MKTLIIAEHDNQQLKLATARVVTAAKELTDNSDMLVIGKNCHAVVNEAKQFLGIKTVLVADNDVYEHQLAENCAALIAKIAADYDYILISATTFGKNLLPRVAALLDVAMISDVIKIISPNTFLRPIYAGNALLTVEASDKIKLLSIRTTAFAAATKVNTQNSIVNMIEDPIANTVTHFVSHTLTQSARPDLTAARVVISGGRGLKSAENFQLLDRIADLLGAAVGASRAAVDAGFAPNDYQVGQTGKVVAPELYIAVGISGAVQHLAGMKDSKIIVAINNDPDAPIFQIADYGLVGDLFKVLPELKDELERAKES